MTEAPIVRVEQGELQGKVVNGPSGKAYYSFQGIPYAKPPLGSLRFKAPQPPESWDGVRDATSEGNVSAQFDPFIHKQYIGDENCLFLNVYTPNLDGEFLPVMLFIHGGRYHIGSGNSSLHGGDYLVDKDVVVVTINYRCGPLGFLSLNTPEVPGNAGLKDMVQAIRWIKQNVGSFGGNSGNITLFGNSAGGAVVSLLAASPLTKNLISKAIIQSGTALNSWAFQKNPIENARKLADTLGCESGDANEILDFLSTTPIRDIVEAHERLQPAEEFSEKGTIMFAPIVEKEFPGVESVLTEPFIDILTSGRVANIPIMIGTVGLEFPLERSADDLQSYIPAELHIERNSEESLAIANDIKRLYFKEKPPTGVDSMKERFELISDVLINIDTHRFIDYLINTTNKSIFYYKFDYVGELNIAKHVLNTFGLGHALHSDELGYLFKNIWQADVEPTNEDVRTRERMLRLWTNFAKTGNPTPEENHHITVTWLPVTKDNLYNLYIGNELSLVSNPDKEKMAFWDNLYTKHFKLWDHHTTVVHERTINVQEETSSNVQIEIITHETHETHETLETHETNSFQDTTPIIVQETVIQTASTEDTAVDNMPEPNTETAVEETETVAPEINQIDKEEPPHNGVNNLNGNVEKKPRPSNEIKMVQHSNGHPRDVIRANDPPEDDLPKNIGVNKFVNFFESLGGKK